MPLRRIEESPKIVEVLDQLGCENDIERLAEVEVLRVTLDGFEVDGTRSPVCAYSNGNLNDCSVRTKVVGYLYVFDLKGKQEGTFSFSNISINAPGNRMSTQLYIK